MAPFTLKKTKIKIRYFQRVALAFTVAVLAVATLFGPALALSDQLTYGDAKDLSPQINDSGWVTWMRKIGTRRYQIYLFNGVENLLISDDSHNINPEINNNGWVAWACFDAAPENPNLPSGSGAEIFLYDGKKTTRLTDNNFADYSPQIADNGWVVWQGYPPDQEDTSEIYLYDGKRTKRLTRTFNSDAIGNINGHGQVVWVSELTARDLRRDVLTYDGSQTVRLTNDNADNYMPQINDNGWVTWARFEPPSPGQWIMPPQVMLYNGHETTAIATDISTDTQAYLDPPQINNNGWIAWGYYSGDRAPIYLYDGSDTIKLSDNGFNPRINDWGWVTWAQSDGHDYEIFLYDGGEITQLTNNEYDDLDPSINNILWEQNLGSLGQALAMTTSSSMKGAKPQAHMRAPDLSTRVSKTTTFRVRWSAYDPAALAWKSGNKKSSHISLAGASGVKSYSLQVRSADLPTWTYLKINTAATYADFKGKPGKTYYFRVAAKDKAGNVGWSKVRPTTVPFNENHGLYKRTGFNGYRKSLKSQYYMNSVRYSDTAGDTLKYKLVKTDVIGLVTTKGKNRGRAEIYIDGKRVATVDAFSPSSRPRRLIFSKRFSKKRTHYLTIKNLGTPGRPRFDVDAIVATD